MNRTEVMQKMNGVLDSEKLYDILPGDGKDDYIIGFLKDRIWKALKEFRN